LDSLLALDLRRRLRRTLGHSAPVAQMLGGITFGELIEELRPGSAAGAAVSRTRERLEPTRD
jgi:mycobactin polyketide synthetase MbtD